MRESRPLRADRRRGDGVFPFLSAPRSWLSYSALAVGFGIGLVLTVFRGLVPEQFQRDALKIWNIARGARPDFVDQSFTPVALVYRSVGLGDAPIAAGLVGYVVAAAVIVFAVMRAGRRAMNLPLALLVVASFALAGVYLGQYSKDVFVLPVVALLMLPTRSRLWEAVPIAGMLAYAYFFRDYWAIIAVGYIAYRIVTLRQVRVRWLLAMGALAAVAVSACFYLFQDRAPNHYRLSVHEVLDANTSIVTVAPFPQPWGGLVDIFVNYWLVLAPVVLPFIAGASYLLATAALIYLRFLPLVAARSSIRWPEERSSDGVLMRRGLSLLLSFAAVQALFEPDYGSSLRHLAPLLPLAILVCQAMRSGVRRLGPAAPWSWSGAARDVTKSGASGDRDADASHTETTERSSHS